MAEIPITKDGGSKSWLWILLALLAVALIAWWALADNEDETAGIVANEAVVESTVVDPAVTQPGLLTVGETVDLDGVEVSSLAGDMAFYIEMNGERVPVFFDQVPTPGDATEGEYDINPGSIVNIDGEVRSATDTLPANADPSILGDSQNYIFANSIEMVR